MSNLISLNQIKRHYDVGGELVKALDGVEKIIQIILVSKDLSLGALMSLEQAIENSDQKFDNADQFLKLIEQKRDALESELESELGPDFEPTDEEF